MFGAVLKCEAVLEDDVSVSDDPYSTPSSQLVIDLEKTLEVKVPRVQLKDILPRPRPEPGSPSYKPVARKRTTPIPKRKLKRAPASTPEDKPVFQFEFEVEGIRGKRVRNNKIEYLIKWVGWAPSTSTWEPEEHLENCKDIVEKYERSTRMTYDREFKVERIVGKETDGNVTSYLVKWEGWDDKYNTWEPEQHLTHCKTLVDDFNEEERKKGNKAKFPFERKFQQRKSNAKKK